MEMVITYDLLKSYSNEELTAIELSIDEIKKKREMANFKEKKEAFEKAFEALLEIGAKVYDAEYGEEIHEFEIAM